MAWSSLHLQKNGELFFSQLRIDCVVDKDDKVTHHIGSIVDLSKEHEAEMEITSVSNMLNRAGEMAKLGGW